MVYLNFLLQFGQLVQCKLCRTVRAGYLTSCTEVSREEAVGLEIMGLAGRDKEGAERTGTFTDDTDGRADMFGSSTSTSLGKSITEGKVLGWIAGTGISSGSSTIDSSIDSSMKLSC